MLENIVLKVDFTQGHSISKVDILSQRVISDVGSGKERQIKDIELKLTVAKVNGELPLSLKIFNYLRRM